MLVLGRACLEDHPNEEIVILWYLQLKCVKKPGFFETLSPSSFLHLKISLLGGSGLRTWFSGVSSAI